MIAEFHFLRPWWLLAQLVPPLVVWLALRAGDLQGRWKGLIAPHLLQNLIIEPDAKNHARPSWLLAVVIALAVLGAAGPTWRREPPPFVSDTASLVIAVDLSPSMDDRDVSPSRIERAKLKIRDVLAARRGARTAIVAYSGTAHLVVPLTEDNELIQSYTDALATRIMPKPGKDTAAAVLLAHTLMSADGMPGTILLITDGVEATAAQALNRNVVILGIGTAEGGVDLGGLKHIAASAGSPVASITDDDADVRWVGRQVRTNFAAASAATGDRWRDAGWYLLFPLVIAFALTFRRGWIVRVSGLMIVAKLIAPVPADAAGFMDLWLTQDQQGRLAFERGDFTAAAILFTDPMWKGTALYRAGRFKEAAQSFAPLTTPDARFNRGNALLRLGSYEEAVAAYRQALQRRKDWPEAEANLAIAERLLKLQQDDDQPQDPNEKPDDLKVDDKGKKGKAGKVDVAEQPSELWMRNIVVSPADLMARKFAIEAERNQR
ncbi:VWA domain-containing protein [Neorhizobium alkalisoli]|uniref:Ca-activated chloride channel family protein n=1 Tax=Neorhizobium alkalisoli TaxID=528178 RepID=A0A561QBS8_9HYPH|nr:VWA domain-containing protein [Neorhizobium alkalisoli]TWF47825.1 Ca-activated chloride channel family protein [Neorhizobium alkalisoli]